MTNEKSLLYKQAHVELYEIIKNITEKERLKIPEAFISNLVKNSDDSYIFQYDKSKNILEQNLMNETKALLIQMYIKYIAPEEEKELWKDYNRICLNDIEKEKNNKYNYENLFKDQYNSVKPINKTVTNELSLVEYKESILKKIWNKILSIFKK